MYDLRELTLYKEGQDSEFLQYLFELSSFFYAYQYSVPIINQSIYNNKFLLHRHFERFASIMPFMVKGDFVLDVGCGFGDLSLEIASKGHKIVSIDLDRNMLDIAKLRFKRLNLDGNIVVADALNLPFKDRTFDVVLSNQVIEHVSNVDQYFKEKKRVGKTVSIEICENNSRLSLLNLIYYKIVTRKPLEEVPEIGGYSEKKYINLELFPFNSKATILLSNLLGKLNFIKKWFSGQVVKIYHI